MDADVGYEAFVDREARRSHWARLTARSPLGVAAATFLAAVLVSTQFVGEIHLVATGSRSAIETSITLSAVVAAALLWVHYERSQRLRDLLLLAALGTIALTDFFFNTLPAVGDYQLGTHGIGAHLAGALLATSALTVAAFIPYRRRAGRGGRRLAWFAVLASLCAIGGAELLGIIVGPSGTNAVQHYRPAMEAVAAISCAGLLLAGWRFTTGRFAADEQAMLLGGAAFLFAGASLQKMRLPLPASDWVTPADLLRLTAYACLLLAALRLVVGSRQQITADAVSAERVKIAHDLHDGLAQDLALIAAHSERLEREFGVDHPLVVAAKRALAISRGQIVGLARPETPSLPEALRELAAELEQRYGIDISLSVQEVSDPQPSAADRHELIRIVREATANAVYHGRARHVAVTVGSPDSNLLLRVVDDGCGIGSQAAQTNPGSGLGMSSMRSGARSLGGDLTACHIDAGGTQIEVVAGRARS
jgi:signal transduction histidine kinase